MKITVLGASGQIGAKVVALLRDAGHQTVAASRGSGADVLTGEGLGAALAGADVLVDVVNSPSFDDEPVMNFFSTLVLARREETRAVVVDPSVTYFGAQVGDTGLVTGADAVLASTRLADWLASR